MSSNNVNTLQVEGSTFNSVGRDQYNVGRDQNIAHYHIYAATGQQDVQRPLSRSGSPSRQLSSSALSFNDAPIYHISPYFTGRDEELEAIGVMLSIRCDEDIPTCGAIFGMPGLGKTQLGMEYAKRSYNKQKYNIIFWISAANVEHLNQSFTNILHLVDHRHQHHPEQNARFMFARRWLEATDLKWLLVVDNVYPESILFLREHMPRCNSRGSVLFTTRTSAIALDIVSTMHQNSHILEIQPLSVSDAVALLHREAHITDSGKVAEDVVKSVGCLPLAVSQAASFMNTSRKNLQDVLELYQSDRKYEMISWENNLSRFEEKSIVVLFSSTLGNLERQFPDICSLLQVLSFFDPESITMEMIVGGAQHLGRQHMPSPPLPVANTAFPVDSRSSIRQKLRQILFKPKSKPKEVVIGDTPVVSPESFPEVDALKQLILSPILLLQAVQRLQQLSLLSTDSKSDMDSTLQIHDLTHTIVQEYARKKSTYRQWFDVASALVCGAFLNISDVESPMCWADCEALNPHIGFLVTLSDKRAFEDLVLNKVCTGMAWYLKCRGRYDESESLRRTMATFEKALGLEHADTLEAVHRLAVVTRYKGKYDEAESLCKQALAGREKVLGTEHPDTLMTINNFAIIYEMKGKYDEAESLYRRALAGQEKVLGTEHPDTLRTVHDLSVVLRLKRQFDEAESLGKQALAVREKALGPDHPNTLMTVGVLANVYWNKGKYDKAKQLFKRVLTVQEEVLGPEHPDTLRTVECLAILSGSQGKYAEADLLYAKALAGNEKLLGFEHPRTLSTVYSLALLRRNQSRLSESEALFDRALKGQQKALGSEHPDTLDTVKALTSVLDDQGCRDEAKALRDQYALS